jgi:2-succinyl-6-hydroxy-2,4-cyclohexadiene-1-carboxylate synthase
VTGLPMPTLIVAGARDLKFVALAERLAASIPRATLEIVPDAGHAVHLERPDEFIARLARWLPGGNRPAGRDKCRPDR